MLVRRIALLFACVTVAAAAHAQALPSATSSGVSYQAGGGISFGQPDYADDVIKGVTVFGNMDFHSGLGLVLEYHNLELVTPQDIGEASIVGGIRYGRRYKGKFYPYIKATAGVGTLQFEQGTYATTTSYNYKIYAVGGGVEYHTDGHLMLRLVDFEYQDWPNFQPNGLDPYVITIGAGYRWH